MAALQRGSPTDDGRFHLAPGREGSCGNVLRLGINSTVSGLGGGGGFGVEPSEVTVCVIVELEGLSMPRSRMTASCLAYFLASCGSTGSMYLCLLGVGSRGGLVRGTGLGTIILVTVIRPDWEMGEGVMADVEGVDGVGGVGEGVGVVADELDLLELDEL